MHPAFPSLALVTLFAADIALAQVPSRNMILRAHKNDYCDPTVSSSCLGADEGLQIISMANPQAPVLFSTYEVTFNRSHTISVDTSRGLLVCNGTRNARTRRRGSASSP